MTASPDSIAALATELATRAIDRRREYRNLVTDGDTLHIAMDSVVLGHDADSLVRTWVSLLWGGDDHGQEMLGEIDYERLSRARSVPATVRWLDAELRAVQASYTAQRLGR